MAVFVRALAKGGRAIDSGGQPSPFSRALEERERVCATATLRVSYREPGGGPLSNPLDPYQEYSLVELFLVQQKTHPLRFRAARVVRCADTLRADPRHTAARV